MPRRRVDTRGRSVKNYAKEGEKNADRVVYRREEKGKKSRMNVSTCYSRRGMLFLEQRRNC